jgi:hypothetical protein
MMDEETGCFSNMFNLVRNWSFVRDWLMGLPPLPDLLWSHHTSASVAEVLATKR